MALIGAIICILALVILGGLDGKTSKWQEDNNELRKWYDQEHNAAPTAEKKLEVTNEYIRRSIEIDKKYGKEFKF